MRSGQNPLSGPRMDIKSRDQKCALLPGASRGGQARTFKDEWLVGSGDA